jgi:hypothetical protein
VTSSERSHLLFSITYVTALTAMQRGTSIAASERGAILLIHGRNSNV